MLFTVSLYISLAICIVGVVYRIRRWLTLEIGTEGTNRQDRKRIRAALTGIGRTLSGRRIFPLTKALVWEVFLQGTLFRANPWRWVFHICLFYGFVMLLLMHALDEILTARFLPDYVSTLSPFLFLRNLFGAAALGGILFFALRRLVCNSFAGATNIRDISALGLLGFIMASGFLLEGAQIVSAPIFDEMVADYMDPEDPEEIVPLKAF